MKKISFLFIATMVLSEAYTQSSSDSSRMAWWRDAKFGMFIHWGVYSVPAGTYDGKKIPGIGEWIMNTGKIPVARYRLFADSFNPVRYDPEAWVKMAKNAGVRYIVITSKHHDGFALYDSKVTTWDVVDATPFGKDLLAPLVKACRKENIRIGFYYSQAQDWNHPGGAARGGHWDKEQEGDFDIYLDQIAVPQVKEILSNYGDLDILWWDTPQDMTAQRAEKFLPILQNYPSLITNNRLGGNYKGDLETPEQFVPSTGYPGRNWESCMTMNDTWGYKSYDSNWKSTKTLVRNLVDIVSKGGNFLLNVGPNSIGEIPEPSIQRMQAIGMWLQVNQESIYGTTASPFPFLSWGRATRKGQKLFLHVFEYPATGVLHVPLANKITSAYFLTAPQKKLQVISSKDHSQIQMGRRVPDTVNTVVVVEFNGEPVVPPGPTAGLTATVSSQKPGDFGAANLLDGDRLTRWEAASGQKTASIEIELREPTVISAMVVDEPWHPWDNVSQRLILQFWANNQWKSATEILSSGIGLVQKFPPVTAKKFRLLLENVGQAPSICEWQLF